MADPTTHNCWTCRHDAHPSGCRILHQQKRRGTRRGVKAWLAEQDSSGRDGSKPRPGLYSKGYPPRHTAPCPGWELDDKENHHDD